MTYVQMQLLISGLILVNLTGFALVGTDKAWSKSGRERFPEVSFFFFAALFASAGVLLGIFFFRHKTQKLYFPLGIGILLAQQAYIVYSIYSR